MNRHSLKDVKFIGFGYPDEFVKQGSIEQIEEKYGLTEKQISEKIQKEMFSKGQDKISKKNQMNKKKKRR